MSGARTGTAMESELLGTNDSTQLHWHRPSAQHGGFEEPWFVDPSVRLGCSLQCCFATLLCAVRGAPNPATACATVNGAIAPWITRSVTQRL